MATKPIPVSAVRLRPSTKAQLNRLRKQRQATTDEVLRYLMAFEANAARIKAERQESAVPLVGETALSQEA